MTTTGCADELCEEVGSEHEEGSPRRMAYFQLVCRGDELGAVPEACCGLHRAAVDVGSDGEGEPPHQVVDKSEMSHFLYLYIYKVYKIPCKGTTFNSQFIIRHPLIRDFLTN